MLVLLICDEEENKKKRGKTRKWIKRREEKGYFCNIVKELRTEDLSGYREMMRMNYNQFLTILLVLEPHISKKQVIGGHKTISAAERLTLTIRFLASGETFRSLCFQFRMGRATISSIVREVCQVIFKCFREKYLKSPTSITEEEWLQIAHRFEERWQFPNCIGAVDGKHIVLRPPPRSGSYFFNDKKSHSIVLMAVAGPEYQCLYADVGTNGRVSDGGVWNNCGLLNSLENSSLQLPNPRPLPFGKDKVPFVLLGDDAFGMREFLLKPYAQRGLTPDKRIFNYRQV
ncbi:uncharacterized protein [Montipora foliosa]|uniref:uncharacterized protein n=1 Tax=Montipora foliosa TaxID=591990 RepID=UPI0035F1278F